MDTVIDLSEHQRANMQVTHCQPDDPKKKVDKAEDSAKGFCAAQRSGKAEVERNNA
jgi:hypothetical protein